MCRSRKIYVNREPRNEPTITWAINVQQVVIINNEEKTVSPKNDVEGKLDSCMQKNQTGLLFHTKYKNKLKMDSRFKWKSWNHKTSRRRLAVNFLTLVLAIFEMSPQSKRNKSKNKQMRLHQTKIFCTTKEIIQQKPKAT